eukprot:GHVS01037990.1.p1 GENE.GHVS01037990.1~~GHVS01037990.1.p1  ORF type:complete len:296 (+),score=68.23 GHVS01037990.1:120-890(+)
MGGDGGSIPSRGDVVRTKGYKFARNLGGMGYVPNTQVRSGDDKMGKNEERTVRWTTCAISQDRLRLPIVACRLGQLYNKEVLLQCLLEKQLPPHASHIKSLKHSCKTLNVSLNSKGSMVCPFSLVELEGGIRGSFNWNCGCVLADRAMANMTNNHNDEQSSASSGLKCLNCGSPYASAEDIIPLVPDDDQLIQIKEKLASASSIRTSSSRRRQEGLPENNKNVEQQLDILPTNKRRCPTTTEGARRPTAAEEPVVA